MRAPPPGCAGNLQIYVRPEEDFRIATLDIDPEPGVRTTIDVPLGTGAKRTLLRRGRAQVTLSSPYDGRFHTTSVTVARR